MSLPSHFWNAPLLYTVTPKSGPMRAMTTLLDLNRSLNEDLPRGSLKIPRWRNLAVLLVRASETGARDDIEAVTAELVFTLSQEGWMTRSPLPSASGPVRGEGAPGGES